MNTNIKSSKEQKKWVVSSLIPETTQLAIVAPIPKESTTKNLLNIYLKMVVFIVVVFVVVVFVFVMFVFVVVVFVVVFVVIMSSSLSSSSSSSSDKKYSFLIRGMA